MGKLISLKNLIKKPSLTLGRPIARSPKWENQIKFYDAFAQLSADGYGLFHEDLISYSWWGNSVCGARNRIVSDFLKRKSDYLIFFDDDMTVVNLYEDIKKMIAMNKDVVGAIGVTKGAPHNPNIAKFIKISESRKAEDSFTLRMYDWPKEPFQVDAVGAAFMCIKRKVIEKMRRPLFYMPANYNMGDIMGEDTVFCFNAKMHGFEIWVDPTIKMGHIGDGAFSLDLRCSCYMDFKEELIKEADEDRIGYKKKIFGDKIPGNVNWSHHLVADVQDEMKKGLGPGVTNISV